jgi:hypothetical protein
MSSINAKSMFIFLSVFICPMLILADDTAPGRPQLSCAQMEEFLLHAKIGRQTNTSKGVTNPKRATLEDGGITHDAAIQTIHESKTKFEGTRGTEMNFKDFYEFNIAGYELAKLLELNMVPPYVPRKVGGQPASFSWWVNDAMMEIDRTKNKIEPPDVDAWNKQMYAVRVFHELVYDTDPNLTNLLITKDWQIWMIDSSRAFRMYKKIGSPANLVQIDRKLLAKLRELDKDTLQQKLGKWLNKMEIEGLDARRQLIVQHFDNLVKQKGEAAVLYDFPRTSQACGVGL